MQSLLDALAAQFGVPEAPTSHSFCGLEYQSLTRRQPNRGR
jgi:hypothetical protein